MARIRSIKPEFWTSAQVAECSTNARLLFIGLWNFCDDAGRHPMNPKQIKMEVFPADAFSLDDVRRMLDELATNELIQYYTVDGKDYFHVTGWRHQKIDRPQSAKYPEPIADHSTNTRRPFVPDTIGYDTIGSEAARAISVEEVSKPLAKAKDPDDEAAIALGTKALKLVGKHDDPTWSFGEVYAWRQVARENGLDDARLERIVETEIKRMTAGKPVTARSLKYFTPAITEAIMLRIDKPLQRPPPEDLPPVDVPVEYRAAVDQLAKLIGPRAHTVAYSQGLGSWQEKTAFIEREIEFEQRGAA